MREERTEKRITVIQTVHGEDSSRRRSEGLFRDNVGLSKCWKGYKAKGTKMKGGKEVPNCVPEEVHQAMADQDDRRGYTEEDVRLGIEWREDGFNVIFEEDGFRLEESD